MIAAAGPGVAEGAIADGGIAAGETIEAVAAAARACTVCAASLPLGPRPVFRISATARVLIIGQAPGTKVHASGIPWNDPSGDRLRDWLGIDRATFYDDSRIAIVPMGLCYPGRLRAAMPAIRLTLLVGSHAILYHLGKGSMEARVRGFAAHLPAWFPLPHPSWRTRAWAARRPWFETEVIPALRDAFAAALSPQGDPT